MAKIKRFYLFIAALIWTKPYATFAATPVTCDANTYAAMECYTKWSQKYANGELTYREYKQAGFSESEYSPCQSWSDNYDYDTGDLKDTATCEELYDYELADFCCQLYNAQSNCSGVLQESYFCQTVTYDQSCSDESIQDIVQDITYNLEPAMELVSVPNVSKADLEDMGFNPTNACASAWEDCRDGTDAYINGVLSSCAICPTLSEGDLIAQACNRTMDPVRCWYDAKGDPICVEDTTDESVTCGSGTYLDSSRTMCLVCPDYVHSDGSEDNTIIWSDENSEQITDCYVPQNTSIINDLGTFVFDFNCNYSGS